MRTETRVVEQKTVVRWGAGIGSMIAVTASWSVNQSILWALLHGIFGWFYVLYFALFVR